MLMVYFLLGENVGTTVVTCRHRNAAQNHNIQMANKFFENVEPKYLGQMLRNLNRSHEEIDIKLGKSVTHLI